jgi:hypothetical protein
MAILTKPSHNPHMRVAFISDLHIDVCPKNEAIFPKLVIAVQHAAPDLFVLAGDVANTASHLALALSHFSNLDCPRYFVPGNHDVWIESHRSARKGFDSAHKHDSILPQICCENGFHYLPASPTIIGKIAFIGTIGWYNYTMADSRLRHVFSLQDYEKGDFRDANYRLGQWMDCQNGVWLRKSDNQTWFQRRSKLSAPEVFELHFSRVSQDLSNVAPRAQSLVAITHTLPFVECLGRSEVPDPFDAYQGSTRLGAKLVEVAQKIPVTCVCAHKHRPFFGQIQGIRVLRSPLGYLDTFKGDLLDKAMQCVSIFEV